MKISAENPGRASKVYRAIRVGYLNSFFTLAISLFLTPFVITHVGSANYGRWLIMIQIITFMDVFELGLSTLLVQEIARHSAIPSPHRRIILYARTLSKYLPFLALHLFLLFGALFFLRSYFTIDLQLDTRFFLILGVALLATRIFKYFGLLLNGLMELETVGKYFLAGFFINAATTILLAIYWNDVAALACGWLAGELVTCSALFRWVVRHHRAALSRMNLDWKMKSVFTDFKRSLWLVMGQLSHALLNATDNTLIGRSHGEAATTSYSMTQKLANIGSHFPNQVYVSATPSMFQAATDKVAFRRTMIAVIQVTLAASGFVACGFLAVNSSFVNGWVGPTLFGGNTLTVLIAISLFLKHLVACTVFISLWAGKFKESVFASFVQGASYIGLALVLTSLWGASGTVLATIVSSLCFGLPVSLYFAARFADTQIRDILSMLVFPSARIIGAMSVSFAISFISMDYVFVEMALKGSLACVVYIVLMRSMLLGPYVSPYLSEDIKNVLAGKIPRSSNNAKPPAERKAG